MSSTVPGVLEEEEEEVEVERVFRGIDMQDMYSKLHSWPSGALGVFDLLFPGGRVWGGQIDRSVEGGMAVALR